MESEERAALLALDRLDQPPVILEGSSAVIWRLLDPDGAPIAQCALVDQVADYYGEPAGEIAVPVVDFLTEMHRLGFLEQVLDDD